MKLISHGGAESRYSPPGSVEAYYLALKTDFVYGVGVDVYFTKDEQLVSFTELNFKKVAQTSEFLKYNSLDDIQKHNIGSKVKSHSPASLEQIMQLFSNSDKILVLDLKNQQERNLAFVNAMVKLAEKYPLVNLYLKSCTLEIIKLLQQTQIRARIGIVIEGDTREQFDKPYDFYSLIPGVISPQKIEEKLKQFAGIMFEAVNDRKTFLSLVHLFKPYAEELFFITEQVGLLNAVSVYDLRQ